VLQPRRERPSRVGGADPTLTATALPVAEQSGDSTAATVAGVKRLRPISRDVRRSTEVNRDLLYESDEHLKRDAEFPPMRGKPDSAVRWDVAADAEPAAASESAHSRCASRVGEMRVLARKRVSASMRPTSKL